MSSPVIWNGTRSKILTSNGLLTSAGRTIDFDGAINYIANPGAEINTTGWSTYADAAANIPVDGTGGTATGLTFSRTTSSPLNQTASFSMVQANSTSLQGKGVSYDFTIDSAYQAQPLGISFNFNASSTFVAGNGSTPPLNDGTTTTNAGNSDIEVFIYDVTNGVLIPVTPQTITAKGTNNFVFGGSFQTASNSTSYRLIFHVATTSANATGWTFKFDNVVVGPQAVASSGSIISDWFSYVPAIVGAGTPTNIDFKYRRNGNMLQVQGAFTIGTSSGTASIPLPTGLVIDTGNISKISGGGAMVGQVMAQTSSGSAQNYFTNAYTAFLFYDGSDTSNIYASLNTQSAGFVKAGWTTFGSNNTGQSVRFEVPIAGWSNGQTISGTSAGPVVIEQYTGNAGGTVTANVTNIDFTTKVTDTSGAWSGTVFTAPSSQWYSWAGAAKFTTATTRNVSAYVNGVQKVAAGGDSSEGIYSMAGGLYLNAGDQLSFRTDTTSTLSNNSVYHVIAITSQGASASQNLANQTVKASYYASAASQTPGANTQINFDTKLYDSNSAVTTGAGAWKFTAPVSGTYSIKGMIGWTSTQGYVQLWKNGSAFKYLCIIGSTGATPYPAYAADIQLNAGDYIDLRTTAASVLNGGSAPYSMYVDIIKTGN